MIIPARWFAGGMGLDEFRSQMLNDRRIEVLVDHADASECFPGVEIKGGVCYFLRNQSHGNNQGDDCKVVNVVKDDAYVAQRRLSDYDIFVRNNRAIAILKKVLALKEQSLSSQVSGVQPFGLPTNFNEFRSERFTKAVKLYARGVEGWISPDKIKSNIEWVEDWKVLTAMAAEGDGKFPNRITGKSFVAQPNSACTMTYLVIGRFERELESRNLVQYAHSRFFRFLVSLRKNTQHLTRDRFAFVPQLDMTRSWTDTDLYARYGLTSDEIAYIESMIKEMP